MARTLKSWGQDFDSFEDQSPVLPISEGGEDATIHPQEKWSIFENLTLLLISV